MNISSLKSNLETITNLSENFIKEIDAISKYAELLEVEKSQLTDFDFKLREREKKLVTMLGEINSKKVELDQQKVYVEKLNEQFTKKEENIIRMNQELSLREEKCLESEKEIKEMGEKLTERAKSLGDLAQKEIELKKREEMVKKEIEIDRERKEILSVKEKQLMDKESRLERLTRV